MFCLTALRFFLLLIPIVGDDSGDELTSIGSLRTRTKIRKRDVQSGCALPKFPANGKFELANSAKYIPGEVAPPYSVLLAHCTQGFNLSEPSFRKSVCENGQWDPGLPSCARLCKPVKSTISTKMQCSLNKRVLKDCEYPVEGTIVEPLCKDFYEGPNTLLPVCRNGAWNSAIPYCKPKCGQKRPSGIPTIVGGDVVVIGSYPWHVAVYSNTAYICGGSVLNEWMVISVAHCFTNFDDGSIMTENKYTVGAGKYYSSYRDSRDKYAQLKTVTQIHVPERYKGLTTSFYGDLAILVLNEPFRLSLYVQPICLDLNNDNFEHEQLISGNDGVVVGWGSTTESGGSSESLRELKIPFVPYGQCSEEVPAYFISYLHNDKICGGYLDRGKSVCKGDSGGSWAFINKQNYKFYLRGLVSVSPSQDTNSCDSNQYSAFTSVLEHSKFIIKILRETKISLCLDDSEGTNCKKESPITLKNDCPLVTITGCGHKPCGGTPWQVMIYDKNNDQICGGVIVNERTIISAARCFTRSIDGLPFPKEDYTVAAGKRHRTYASANDPHAQYSRVSKIYLPENPNEQYEGERTFFNSDIAIITLVTPLKFNSIVVPICTGNFEDFSISDTNASVTLWEKNIKSDESPEVLTESNISPIPFDQCYNQLPPTLSRYITFDKTCGRYPRRDNVLCYGNTGRPLSFLNTQDGKYYLYGILSLFPTQCNSHSYALFTLINRHTDFIRRTIASIINP